MCLRCSECGLPWRSLDNGGFEKVLEIDEAIRNFFFSFLEIFSVCIV